MTHPTDALRLVPTDEMIRLGAWRAKLHREANPGDTWEETAREVFIFMSAAAPASPLPGGGQCSGISGELKSPIKWLRLRLAQLLVGRMTFVANAKIIGGELVLGTNHGVVKNMMFLPANSNDEGRDCYEWFEPVRPPHCAIRLPS